MPLLLPARRLFIVAVVVVTGWASHAQAQSDAAPQTLTVNARLVVLDVVVTDKAGKPVDDLTAKDFQVFENGKEQRIRSVEPPSTHTFPTETGTTSLQQTFDPSQPASFGRLPVNVLVLDQLNTHFADSSFARRALHDYLSKQPAVLAQPTTLLTVYDNQFKQLQSFTRDRDALLKALAAAPTKFAWQLEVNGKADHGPLERLDASLRALEQIAESNARIPGRKNLIWVGGGFPSMDPAALSNVDMQEVKDTLQHVTDVLLDTRVTLYAIDPTSSAAGMTEVIDPTQMAFVIAAGESMAGNADPFNASADFDRLGPVTGGVVIRGRNDVAAQIARAIELGTEFYTIAYSPDSTSQSAAQYRSIKVVCLRPGLVATTRSGYYSGQTQQAKSAATASYDLTTAAESAIALNALRVEVEQDRSLNAQPDSWIVRVGAAALTWKPKDDGSSTASVYILAASLNVKNKLLDHTIHPMIATAKPGTNLHEESRMADFAFTASKAAKATRLRFVVRDSATGRMGSFDVPVKH